MRASQTLAIWIFAASLGGCASDSSGMVAYKKLVTEVCACADAACAQAVDTEEQRWRQMSVPNLSQQDRDALESARQGFTACRDDLIKK